MRGATTLDFDVAERAAWAGGRSLVVIPRDACPECGGALDEREIGEQALFRHGGYGATRTSVIAWCHCGWSVVRSITETRP